MKVEQIANGNIRVWLSEEELRRWRLYPPGEDARRMAGRLVRRVLQEVPRPAERMQAELIPVEGGGVLVVSPAQFSSGSPLVFRLQDEETLGEFTSRWQRMPDEELASYCVYRVDDWVYLVLYPVCTPSLRQKYLLAEYGELMGRGDVWAAYLAEHGHPVTAGILQ